MKRTFITSIAIASLVFGVVVGGGSQAAWAADFTNGNFEDWPTGLVAPNWTGAYSATVANQFARSTSPVYGGSYAQKIKSKDTSGSWTHVYQGFDTNVGDALTITGYLYSMSASGYTNPQIGVNTSSDRPSSWLYTLTSFTKQTWISTGSITCNASGTTTYVFLETTRKASGDTSVYWDDFSVYHAYVPPAPAVGNPTSSTLDVNVDPGSNSGNSSAQYAITIGGGSYTLGTNWVQADGSVSTTAVWQSDSTWGTTTVTGLTTGVEYTFQVKARYSSTYPQATSLGASAAGTTNSPIEPPTGAAASTNPICNGNSTTLSATVGSGGDQVWWFTGSCTNGTQVGTSSGNQSVSPSSTTTYYARSKNSTSGLYSGTCDQVAVTVNPIPNAPAAHHSSPVCMGGQLYLWTDEVAGATYSWTGPDNFSSSLRTTSSFTVTSAKEGQYSVTVTVNGCASSAGTTNVTAGTTLSPPTAASAVAENGAITWNWGTVIGATSYRLSDSWGNIIASDITNNYYVENGLDLSVLYLCHVQTVNACGGAGWTQLPSPSAQSSSALLQNGGMEAFTGSTYARIAANWQNYYHGASPDAWMASNGANGGRYAQQIQMHDTGGATTQYSGLRQTIDATPGDAFTFKAQGRTFHNNHTYAGLFITAQWDGSTTPPTVTGEGQGGNSYFLLTTSGVATASSVTIFLHAQRNGNAGDDQLVWFDDAVGYCAYVPPSPDVTNPTQNSLDVNVSPGSNLNNTSAQYAISIGGGAYTLGTHWVQVDGSVGTTPVWQTYAIWSTNTVYGLAGATTYAFQVKARYSSNIAQPTSFSAQAEGTTPCPTVATPTNITASANQLPAGNLPVPQQGAYAYFVVHGGNASSANLPANGGPVVVDLVVATAEAMKSWDVLPSADASNVFSIDATGWTAKDELLVWAGLSNQSLPSYYNCGWLGWVILNTQEHIICRSTVKDAACADRALETGAKITTGTHGLDMLAGAINTPVDSYFTAASSMGAVMTNTMGPGAARVATLTFQVAGVPGIYHLWLVSGSFTSVNGTPVSSQTGPVFDIQVDGQ